jgi:quercetin dioxygenase-like cupin family protein
MTVTRSTALTVAATALFAATALAQAPTFKRTVLHQGDLSTPGREVVMAKAEFPKGSSTGKHTHPGEESSYVASGTLRLEVEGVSKTYKAGESFLIPAGKVHDAINADAGDTVVIANYIVEKGKPVTTPVK